MYRVKTSKSVIVTHTSSRGPGCCAARFKAVSAALCGLAVIHPECDATGTMRHRARSRNIMFHNFYRAKQTQDASALYALTIPSVCLSVCLSQLWIVLERLIASYRILWRNTNMVSWTGTLNTDYENSRFRKIYLVYLGNDAKYTDSCYGTPTEGRTFIIN